MELIQQVFLYVSVITALLFAIGLYKPWIAVWWEDIQNRKKVFTLYGTVLIITVTIYQVLKSM